MTTMVFVNFPVTNIQASTTFYEKIGFKKIKISQIILSAVWFGMKIFSSCFFLTNAIKVLLGKGKLLIQEQQALR